MDDRDIPRATSTNTLGKIAAADRTVSSAPRATLSLMVALTQPTPMTLFRPASGTCGFLVATGEYLREQ